MCIPLRIRGRNQGVISMVSSTREYTMDDVRLAQELATRCTFALDNAHLYQESERALQARTDLMSITSHEIKTPLTSLRLQAQVMRRNYEKGQFDAFSVEKLGKFIELNERQVTRLVRLVDEMLDFTRIEQGKFVLSRESFALKDMIIEINDRFAEQFKQAGVSLETSIEVEGSGNYDRFRLEQAYSNLIVNGLRYGQGKPIHVKLAQSHDGGRYQISVRDEGIGVDPMNFERIFGRFERAISASDVSGLGLGLFITHTIVEAHAGKIWVESPGKNQGSTFVMELPKT
jgi:signal transduction histidine kinase